MVKLSWQNLDDIKFLEQSLKKNKIAIVSTDTIYGFLANTTKICFEKLNNLKGKRGDRPYIILIGSKDKLEHFVDTQSINKNLLSAWPGPLTIIFKAKENLPSFLKSKNNTVAIRIPNHKGLLRVLKNFHGLFSTSANTSVMPTPTKYAEIEKGLLDKISILVDTDATRSIPSTIIDCTNPNKIKIIREGAYSKEELEKYGAKISK